MTYSILYRELLFCYFIQISLHLAFVNPRLVRSQGNLALFIFKIWILKQNILWSPVWEKNIKHWTTKMQGSSPSPGMSMFSAHQQALFLDSIQINKEHFRKAVGRNHSWLVTWLFTEPWVALFIFWDISPFTTAMLWNKMNKIHVLHIWSLKKSSSTEFASSLKVRFQPHFQSRLFSEDIISGLALLVSAYLDS